MSDPSKPGVQPQAVGEPLSGNLTLLPPTFPPTPALAPAAVRQWQEEQFGVGSAQQFRTFTLLGDFTEIYYLDIPEPSVLWLREITSESTFQGDFFVFAFPHDATATDAVRSHGRILYLPTPGRWAILANIPSRSGTFVVYPAGQPGSERWYDLERTANRMTASTDTTLVAAAAAVVIATGMDDVEITVSNTGAANTARVGWGAAANNFGRILAPLTSTTFRRRGMVPYNLYAFSQAGTTIFTERYQVE